MDERARLKRFGIGMAATLVATVVAGAVFGSLAVPLTLAIGLGATLLLGGGRAKR
ncbi:hypothetical protein [Falsiroseomonas selenitidurans]|uniref:Uncharacterized protein n=1 Tax=Falsiroseomonas selenitidurans TaxID=2716335 RepID=A0ABX1E4F7_9PROT|nr:hypothetical protein [Falsiroseomonas selenitidurans]NKC30397.1 hypothetical protein [Falsiroseomonas selenitidurans]